MQTLIQLVSLAEFGQLEPAQASPIRITFWHEIKTKQQLQLGRAIESIEGARVISLRTLARIAPALDDAQQ